MRLDRLSMKPIADKDPSMWYYIKAKLIQFLRVCVSVLILGAVIYQLPSKF